MRRSTEVRRQKLALSEPRRDGRFLDSSDSLGMIRRRGESNGSEGRMQKCGRGEENRQGRQERQGLGTERGR
jgi:hypothetical protein